MVNPLFGSNYKYDPSSGEFVNSKHMQLQATIQEFWPQLRLVWIPKQGRTAEDTQPYAIVDRFDRVIAWFTEADMDRPDMILAYLYHNDLSKHPKGYHLSHLESLELAQRLLEDRKFKETQEEKRELAKTILKSPKHWYTHNKVTYRG